MWNQDHQEKKEEEKEGESIALLKTTNARTAKTAVAAYDATKSLVGALTLTVVRAIPAAYDGTKSLTIVLLGTDAKRSLPAVPTASDVTKS